MKLIEGISAQISDIKAERAEKYHRYGRVYRAVGLLFGLMAGCANIVRISSKDYPQIRPVCEAVKKTLENYPEIAERTAFVRYPTSDEITAEFCKNTFAAVSAAVLALPKRCKTLAILPD